MKEIRRKELGFIFQDFYLMDSLSILENIMTGKNVRSRLTDIKEQNIKVSRQKKKQTSILDLKKIKKSLMGL